MFKDFMWPIVFTAVLLAQPSFNNCTEPQHSIATVNCGKILYHESKIAAYLQDENGEMVLSDKLSEKEIDTIADATNRMNRAIKAIVKERDITIVIRENDKPISMQVPIAAANWEPDNWEPDAKEPIGIMTDKERRNKKLRKLHLELGKRIVATRKTNITNMVIERMSQ